MKKLQSGRKVRFNGSMNRISAIGKKNIVETKYYKFIR